MRIQIEVIGILILLLIVYNAVVIVLQVTHLYCVTAAEREAVGAAERAERKQQLRDKVSSVYAA